jgi:hypothetical protein
VTGPIDYLRMVLAGEVASDAVLRKATAALDAIQDELDHLTVLDAAPGGAALDSAVDALLQQSDMTGDSDLAPVAEWLHRVSALNEDAS